MSLCGQGYGQGGPRGDPLRNSIVTIGTDSASATLQWWLGQPEASKEQSFIAGMKIPGCKHKEHPNRSGESAFHEEMAEKSPAVHCVSSRWDRSVSDASAK